MRTGTALFFYREKERGETVGIFKYYIFILFSAMGAGSLFPCAWKMEEWDSFSSQPLFLWMGRAKDCISHGSYHSGQLSGGIMDGKRSGT